MIEQPVKLAQDKASKLAEIAFKAILRFEFCAFTGAKLALRERIAIRPPLALTAFGGHAGYADFVT